VVDKPAFVNEVVFGGTSCFDLAFGSIIASFVTSPSCCNVYCTALSTTFVYNATVSLSMCGGAVRFLDDLEKTCVACVILFQLATLGPIQHLFVGGIST
jgi:hypothetical protein